MNEYEYDEIFHVGDRVRNDFVGAGRLCDTVAPMPVILHFTAVIYLRTNHPQHNACFDARALKQHLSPS